MPWGGLQQKLLAKLASQKAADVTPSSGRYNGRYTNLSNQKESDRSGAAVEGAEAAAGAAAEQTIQLAPGCPFPEPEVTDETRP